MIPSQILFFEKFATTENGKIDLKFLKSSSQETPEKEHQNTNLSLDEKIIYKIWQEILPADSMDINDHFFELGGTSLGVLILVSKIQEACGVKLMMSDILTYPTIKQLASLVASLKKNNPSGFLIKQSKTPRVVCLHSEEKNKPLFLTPPVGGGIFIYQSLVKALGQSRSIYALEDPGVEDTAIRFVSLQEMASYYVHAMKEIVPQGPYLLAGASFGATLVIEMARQLLSTGDTVNFIGLFDGWAHYPDIIYDKAYFHQFMLTRMKTVHDFSKNKLIDMQFSREGLLRSYAAPVLPQKITLFKSQEVWDFFKTIDCPNNGWQPHTTQPVERYSVPGDHESMFYQPHVQFLAKALMQGLASIN